MADDKITIRGTLTNGRRICLELEPDMESLNEIDNFFKAFGYEKVVHCKDCKFSEYDNVLRAYYCRCRRVSEDHYCGYGELRDGKDKQQS